MWPIDDVRLIDSYLACPVRAVGVTFLFVSLLNMLTSHQLTRCSVSSLSHSSSRGDANLQRETTTVFRPQITRIRKCLAVTKSLRGSPSMLIPRAFMKIRSTTRVARTGSQRFRNPQARPETVFKERSTGGRTGNNYKSPCGHRPQALDPSFII